MDRYRSVMEVLKWLEPGDLLNGTAVGSIQGREVSDSDELWRCQFPEPVDSGIVAAKRFYSEKLRQKAYIALRKSLICVSVSTRHRTEIPLSQST